MPSTEQVLLTVHDVSGRVLHTINRRLNKGYNEIQLNSRSLGSGILYYTLQTPNYNATRKMVILSNEE